jgi:hypothetical protein
MGAAGSPSGLHASRRYFPPADSRAPRAGGVPSPRAGGRPPTLGAGDLPRLSPPRSPALRHRCWSSLLAVGAEAPPLLERFLRPCVQLKEASPAEAASPPALAATTVSCSLLTSSHGGEADRRRLPRQSPFTVLSWYFTVICSTIVKMFNSVLV